MTLLEAITENEKIQRRILTVQGFSENRINGRNHQNAYSRIKHFIANAQNQMISNIENAVIE